MHRSLKKAANRVKGRLDQREASARKDQSTAPIADAIADFWARACAARAHLTATGQASGQIGTAYPNAGLNAGAAYAVEEQIRMGSTWAQALAYVVGA